MTRFHLSPAEFILRFYADCDYAAVDGLRRIVAIVVFGMLLPGAALRCALAGPFSNVFGSPANLPASAAVEPLVNLPEYRSRNGKLNVTLEARSTRVRLGKFEINGATFNRVYGGPVLRLKPGDVLRLRLINHLPQA